MSKEIKGGLLVLLAGCFWGISGVSGQYLMAAGVSVKLLTSLRLMISGLVMVSILFVKDRSRLLAAVKSRQTMVGILVFSICGLMLNQFAYLQAIHYTNAATATVLQYVTPILILILVCLRNRRLPAWSELLAILLAMSGTFIIATHGQWGQLAMTPMGLFFGILSAFTYAAYIMLPIKLIKEWGSLLVIGLGMLIGGLIFPVLTQVWQEAPRFSWGTLPAYIGIIGIGTILAYTLFLKGVSLVGEVKGSLLASIEPIAAIIFSILLIGETFHAIDLVGMFLIIVAVLVVSLQDLRKK